MLQFDSMGMIFKIDETIDSGDSKIPKNDRLERMRKKNLFANEIKENQTGFLAKEHREKCTVNLY